MSNPLTSVRDRGQGMLCPFAGALALTLTGLSCRLGQRHPGWNSGGQRCTTACKLVVESLCTEQSKTKLIASRPHGADFCPVARHRRARRRQISGNYYGAEATFDQTAVFGSCCQLLPHVAAF